jgi:DNA (cytosine-5)-methyltransferase 1
MRPWHWRQARANQAMGRRPLLLDLFCGAGGAAMGYHRAGFDEIVGVDIKPMKRYPFQFVQGDALEYLAAHGREFDAIHASPPCQAFTALKSMWNAKEHADLVAPTRELLKKIGRPYVIENVPGAPLIRPIMLCGTMFGLGVKNAELRRHRLFELGFKWGAMIPPCAHYHRGIVCGVYGGHGRDRRRLPARDGLQGFPHADRAAAMGIDWMEGNGLSQAIPPAYTEFIGRQLIQALESGDATFSSGRPTTSALRLSSQTGAGGVTLIPATNSLTSRPTGCRCPPRPPIRRRSDE